MEDLRAEGACDFDPDFVLGPDLSAEDIQILQECAKGRTTFHPAYMERWCEICAHDPELAGRIRQLNEFTSWDYEDAVRAELWELESVVDDELPGYLEGVAEDRVDRKFDERREEIARSYRPRPVPMSRAPQPVRRPHDSMIRRAPRARASRSRRRSSTARSPGDPSRGGGSDEDPAPGLRPGEGSW